MYLYDIAISGGTNGPLPNSTLLFGAVASFMTKIGDFRKIKIALLLAHTTQHIMLCGIL